MAENDPVNQINIRKLQELFRGRFEVEEARQLLEHFQWQLDRSVTFVLESSLEEVKQVTGTDNEGWQVVRNRQIWRELARRNEIESEIRQFSCQQCDSMWWRKVPVRKMVSKCYRCRNKYEAVPREHEWGWAQYTCENCGRSFRGFGKMNSTWSPCFNCNAPNQPTSIYPPRVRERRYRRQQDTHTCFSENCYNRSVGPAIEGSICVHPRSLTRRVVYPSHPHVSTGSTVDTFLSQDDLQSHFSSYAPSLPSVNEDDPRN